MLPNTIILFSLASLSKLVMSLPSPPPLQPLLSANVSSLTARDQDNMIRIKFCNGRYANSPSPEHIHCTGDCTEWTSLCDSPITGRIIDAPGTECVETSGKVLFRSCGWKQKYPKATKDCTPVCDFNPGTWQAPEGLRYIYNTISTRLIDVFPNPEGIWEKDFDCRDPIRNDLLDSHHYD
jgi:hypothetical protein